MGLKKLNRWIKNKVYGYDLPKPVKIKPWKINPEDKICVLAPHPDDETIACGGLLAKFGAQCDVVLLTDGQNGGAKEWSKDKTAQVRLQEFEQAMRFLKVNSFTCLHGKDLSLIDDYAKFAAYDFSRYDYVLMPHPQDNHIDHMTVSAFWRRLQKQKKVKARAVYYELWAPMSLPNAYIDISDVVENKRQAIAFYKSQLTNIDYTSRILGLNHYRGIAHKAEYEEDYALEGTI